MSNKNKKTIATASALAKHLFNNGFGVTRILPPPESRPAQMSFQEIIALINSLPGELVVSAEHFDAEIKLCQLRLAQKQSEVEKSWKLPTTQQLLETSTKTRELHGETIKVIAKLSGSEVSSSSVLKLQFERLISAANELHYRQQVLEQFQQSGQSPELDPGYGADLFDAEQTFLAVSEESNVLAFVQQVDRSLAKLAEIESLQLELLKETADTSTIYEWMQTNRMRTLKARDMFVAEIELKRKRLIPFKKILDDFTQQQSQQKDNQA